MSQVPTIPWKDFGPTLQFLAAGARVRPELMHAYATTVLGGVSGLFSSITGCVGECRHPSLSTLMVSDLPSRDEALIASVVEPLRQLQDRTRIANRMACPASLNQRDSPIDNLSEDLRQEHLNTREKISPQLRRSREIYAAEQRRCVNSILMTAPSPEAFLRLRSELLDGHGLVFDPRARILVEAMTAGRAAHPWKNLLRDIGAGNDFGCEEKSISRTELFGSEFAVRSPYLFHVRPDQIATWWDEPDFAELYRSALLLPMEKLPPIPVRHAHHFEDASTVVRNLVRDLVDGRLSGKGMELDCELAGSGIFDQVETFNDRIDSAPDRNRCRGLLGLPLKLAWTAQLLDQGSPKNLGRFAVSSITTANWCLDQHLNTIQKYDRLAERRNLEKQARAVFAKLRRKAPCTYRDVYRGTNNQRRSDVEPAVEFLREEQVISVCGNRIELVEREGLPEWLDDLAKSNLN